MPSWQIFFVCFFFSFSGKWSTTSITDLLKYGPCTLQKVILDGYAFISYLIKRSESQSSPQPNRDPSLVLRSFLVSDFSTLRNIGPLELRWCVLELAIEHVRLFLWNTRASRNDLCVQLWGLSRGCMPLTWWEQRPWAQCSLISPTVICFFNL